MILDLSDPEAAALESTLKSHLVDLHRELAATEDVNFRQSLRRRVDSIEHIHARLVEWLHPVVATI